MARKLMIVLMVVLLALTGCSSKGGVNGDDAAANSEDGADDSARSGARTGKYGRGSGGRGYGSGEAGELDDPSSPLAKRVIYFMYDSDDVQPQYRSVIAAHANYLAAHPGQTIVLEGHADERGSSEYNIALSEQRGRSVMRMMSLQGVAEDQVRIVSYGEEKPAVSGYGESAWEQNRRVEIDYARR
jgi:peptidoglycan-associated lipoprotein